MEFDFFKLAIWIFILAAVLAVGILRRKTQHDSAGSLGLSPVGDSSNFGEKIFRLYTQDRQKDLRLKHVFSKPLEGGELFLFDLVDKTYDDATVIETRAIAIVSPSLRLPHFVLAPKKTGSGLGNSLSNSLSAWNIANQGALVTVADFPEFNDRFLLASAGDPAITSRFFNASLIRYFLNSPPAQIHAGDTVFVVSLPGSPSDQNAIHARIKRAEEIFLQLQNNPYVSGLS